MQNLAIVTVRVKVTKCQQEQYHVSNLTFEGFQICTYTVCTPECHSIPPSYQTLGTAYFQRMPWMCQSSWTQGSILRKMQENLSMRAFKVPRDSTFTVDLRVVCERKPLTSKHVFQRLDRFLPQQKKWSFSSFWRQCPGKAASKTKLTKRLIEDLRGRDVYNRRPPIESTIIKYNIVCGRHQFGNKQRNLTYNTDGYHAVVGRWRLCVLLYRFILTYNNKPVYCITFRQHGTSRALIHGRAQINHLSFRLQTPGSRCQREFENPR
jgi:hypothetical protein